jgi:glycosyltransferase involved in cell wall biosynthesis
MTIRLLIIQYAGDYREAYRCFVSGGDETYYAQKYSVDVVADLAPMVEEVGTLCCLTSESYDEVLENGVRAIGAGFSEKINSRVLIRLIEDFNPTHIVLRTPIKEILTWALSKKNIKVIATLADSFESKGIRNKIRNYQLVKLLNNKRVEWIGNHGLTSAFSLAQMGISPEKIVPWDWPHRCSPDQFEPKLFPYKMTCEPTSAWNLLYVGMITELKGIGDLIKAISILYSRGVFVKLDVIGKGEVDKFKKLAISLGVENQVEFLGIVANKDIVPKMRNSDVVIIPSRTEYPEGFPMTIYEALCSRTPIIASNHPMFRDKLVHTVNSLVFPSGDAIALAASVETLTQSSEMYEQFSRLSRDTWKDLQIPVKWGDFIKIWISNCLEDQRFLIENSLASYSLL